MAIFFSTILLITACAREDLLSLEYGEGANVQFLDPSGTAHINRTMGYTTIYGGNEYKFASAIGESERNRVVTECAACFDILKDITGAPNEAYVIYVTDGAYTPYTEGNNLYIGYDNIATDNFTAALAQLVYGREVNYGILYGLGARVAEVRGYDIGGTSLQNALTLRELSPEYLDLNYACFLEEYSDDATLDKVQTLSAELFDYLADNSMLDILTNYSAEKYVDYLGDFLEANGVEQYDGSQFCNVAMYGGGNILRLIWETDAATFKLHDDYSDIYAGGSLGENPLNDDYTDLKRHINNFNLQFDYTADMLAQYDLEPQKVEVNLVNDITQPYYDSAEHEIYSNVVSAIKHEYTHSVINREYGFYSGDASTALHAMVYYFSRFPVSENISYGILAEQDGIGDMLESNQYPVYVQFLRELADMLGHDINLLNAQDYFTYYDYVTQYGGYYRPELIAQSGQALTSFGNYLVRTYGERIACKAAFTNSPECMLGKSWGDIIDDWRSYLANLSLY